MTNKQWYLSLPNDLQNRISRNCNELNHFYRFAQWYDDKTELSLTGAFSWDQSPEGHDFWYAIYQTIK